ncbi:hypothetical protein BDY24DRAFT_177999 [Mrakia frigida]|uniref:zinc finger MYND domain-containing protein n=1 Tax=Mrakia frigida TaxID=29902 RepID=UPI003FCBEEBA
MILQKPSSPSQLQEVKDFPNPQTEAVMSNFCARYLPQFIKAMNFMPQSSCSSSYIGILEQITHQPLFVRFLQENDQAKSLLIDLLEKMATYPKDMLENLIPGTTTLSSTLSLLTTLLITSLTLSSTSPNLITLLPLSTREAAINSLNHHHLILTRVARAEKDAAKKDHWRLCMAEIDAMKLILNYEGDLKDVGSGVRERGERERKDGKLVWLRCEALQGMGEEGGAAKSDCNKVRAEMTPCGKCGAVRYCSTEHRRAHIKTHKKNCFKPVWQSV